MKAKLNIIVKIFICIFILNNVRKIVTTLMMYQYYDNYHKDICIIQIVTGLIVIFLLAGILMLKKQALHIFFVFQFINALIISNIEGENDYATHFLVALFLCACMAGILCIKKDGISGWKLINNNGNIYIENK